MTAQPVSVIVRTIGRPKLLAGTLASLARCRPLPAEVVVVDQSGDAATAEVVAACDLPLARVVKSSGRGRSLAFNEGLRAAAHAAVMATDDDCEVREDWIRAGAAALAAAPDAIVTGQVLPGRGDPRAVPSTIAFDRVSDFTGQREWGVLYTGNMAGPRDALLAIGGFDERVRPSAEDCDVCYRWLRSGRRLLRDPGLVVWHRDWRSPEQLVALHRDYQRGLGVFYAKHLRAGDRHFAAVVATDLYQWARSLAAAALGRPRWADHRRETVPSLLQGLWRGWRTFG